MDWTCQIATGRDNHTSAARLVTGSNSFCECFAVICDPVIDRAVGADIELPIREGWNNGLLANACRHLPSLVMLSITSGLGGGLLIQHGAPDSGASGGNQKGTTTDLCRTKLSHLSLAFCIRCAVRIVAIHSATHALRPQL